MERMKKKTLRKNSKLPASISSQTTPRKSKRTTSTSIGESPEIGCLQNIVISSGINSQILEDRKLKASTSTWLTLNAEQEVALAIIKRAKDCSKISKFNVKDASKYWSLDPPILHWLEAYSDKDPHQHCPNCAEMKTFFSSVAQTYSSYVTEIKKDVEHSSQKMRDRILELLLACQFYTRHELMEFMKLLINTRIPEKYAEELRTWNRIQRYLYNISKPVKGTIAGSEVQTETAEVFGSKTSDWLIQAHLQEGEILLSQSEKRFEALAWNHEESRIIRHPLSFKVKANNIEDIFMNRISNATIISTWLKFMATRNGILDPAEYSYLPVLPTMFQDARDPIKPMLGSLWATNRQRRNRTVSINNLTHCNTTHTFSRNCTKPNFPPPIAYLFPFDLTSNAATMNASWLQQLLTTSRARNCEESLRKKLGNLKSCFSSLECDMQRRSVHNNMKSHFTSAMDKSFTNHATPETAQDSEDHLILQG